MFSETNDDHVRTYEERQDLRAVPLATGINWLRTDFKGPYLLGRAVGLEPKAGTANQRFDLKVVAMFTHRYAALTR